jgi:acyl-homoserine-lactone acylase
MAYAGRLRNALAAALGLATLGCAATRDAPATQAIADAPVGAVTILRDPYGAPHLYAAREEDGYWGLGHALAEDRAEGVLIFYLFLRGELAAAFGPGAVGDKSGVVGIAPIAIDDAVQSDLEMRRWRHLAAARENFTSLSPQTQANMTAFIAGFEAYLDEHPERRPAWAPPLEPALPVAASSFLMLAASGADTNPCATLLGEASVPPNLLHGSNIWALSAARTADNAAIFLADSHSPYEFFGTFFYSARIHAGDLDAWLLDIGGMPIGLFGHSRHFAWGWSEGPRRPSDCIAVRTAPGDPRAYLYDGERVAMHVEPYEIAVRGGTAVRGEFEYTRHNGALSPVIERRGHVAYAVSSTYMDRAGRGIDQFRAMLAATDAGDMDEALTAREVYPANVIIAGDDGSIRYLRPGRVPIRRDGARIPALVDGSTSAGSWRGLYPIEQTPQIVDPPQGYLGNQNVSPDMMFDAPFLRAEDFSPSFAFQPRFTGTRQIQTIARLREGTFTFEQARRVVADAHIPGFENWIVALSAALAGDHAPRDPAEQAFVQRLLAFNGDFVPESRPALAFSLTREALRNGDRTTVNRLELAIARGASLTASQHEMLRAAVEVAHTELRDRLGGPERTFGDIYRAGRGGVDAPSRGMTLLPLGGFAESADFGSLWSSAYSIEPDGRRRVSSGTRLPFLVQFTRPIRSESLAAQGVSDVPTSPHYSDQARTFGGGALHSNFFEPHELARVAVSSQTYRTHQP